MSAALIQAPQAIAPASLDTLAAIAVYARTVNDTDTLKSLTARINAARELAKMQDDVRDIRRMLMHAEVAVLTRRMELKDPKLTMWDKIAVKAFHRAGDDATREYVDLHFEDHGKAMQIGRALHEEQKAEDALKQGEEFARTPEQIAEWARRAADRSPGESELAESLRDATREDVASSMRDIIEGYTYTGEPFTVEDVTDALIGRMGSDTYYADDAAFRDGVRRVCREAVRTASAIEFEGERLPSTIAVETGVGWVRIPLASATPAHLASTIREREDQIARDQASVDRLKNFLGSITTGGCGEFEPIADYLPTA